MAHDEGPSADSTPGMRRQFSYNWNRILAGVAVVVVVAAAWRCVYKANQQKLCLHREFEQKKLLLSALAEVPGRKFLVTDVNPEVLRKNAMLK